jgi:hypothetical protein
MSEFIKKGITVRQLRKIPTRFKIEEPFWGKAIQTVFGQDVNHKRVSKAGVFVKNLPMSSKIVLPRNILHGVRRQVARAHEISELNSYAKGDIGNKFWNKHRHISPSVLIEEHNILSTLSGLGSDKARKVYNKLRNTRGEETAISNIYQGYKHGYSPRISRHAKKHIKRILENE